MNNSKVLFLGEAPGYKGCRLSGVPFTSEKVLTSSKSNAIVGCNFDYKIRDVKNPQSESSATIIWEAFENHDIYPLMWNAFPEIFDIERIYAIGNVAYSTLTDLGFEVEKIRHPSMGGKNQFIEGIQKIKQK